MSNKTGQIAKVTYSLLNDKIFKATAYTSAMVTVQNLENRLSKIKSGDEAIRDGIREQFKLPDYSKSTTPLDGINPVEIYTVSEVAALVQMSNNTLNSLIQSRKVNSLEYEGGLYIPGDDVLRIKYMSSRKGDTQVKDATTRYGWSREFLEMLDKSEVIKIWDDNTIKGGDLLPLSELALKLQGKEFGPLDISKWGRYRLKGKKLKIPNSYQKRKPLPPASSYILEIFQKTAPEDYATILFEKKGRVTLWYATLNFSNAEDVKGIFCDLFGEHKKTVDSQSKTFLGKFSSEIKYIGGIQSGAVNELMAQLERYNVRINVAKTPRLKKKPIEPLIEEGIPLMKEVSDYLAKIPSDLTMNLRPDGKHPVSKLYVAIREGLN